MPTWNCGYLNFFWFCFKFLAAKLEPLNLNFLFWYSERKLRQPLICSAVCASPTMQIPNHVLHSDPKTKRRQRKSYLKTIKRAGLNEGKKLTCIEPEERAAKVTSADGPRDFRLQLNQKSMNPLSKDNTLLPWLGAASKSLMERIQSSRIHDVFGKSDSPPPKKNDFQPSSEAIANINASLAAAGHLFKTNISDGFGKVSD